MTEIPKTPQFTETTNEFRSKVMQVGSFRNSVPFFENINSVASSGL